MNWWQKISLKISRWFAPDNYQVLGTISPAPPTEEELATRRKQYVSCFTKSYRCFSGTDIKLYMVPFGERVERLVPDMTDANGDPVCEKIGAIGTVNALQFKDKGDHFGGTMHFVVLESLDEVEKLRGKKMQVLCVAADEHGHLATLLDKPVVFNKYYNWGISIDDLVTEATIDFIIIEEDK